MTKTIKTVAATSTAAATIAARVSKVRAPRAPKPQGPRDEFGLTVAEGGILPPAQVEAPAIEAAPVNPNRFGPAPTQDGLRLTHAIKDGFRPGSGAALFAHTSVFLTHAGLDKTPMPSTMVDTFIGSRAIAYHMSKGNFGKVADKRNAKGELVQRGGIILTPQGVELFAKRKPDAELYSAFENTLCRGELDERTGLKNAAGIIQIAAK